MERIELDHKARRATRHLPDGNMLPIPYPDAVVRVQRGLARELLPKRVAS